MNDRHIRIELLLDVLPVSSQRIFGVAVSIVAIVAGAGLYTFLRERRVRA